MSRFSFLTFSVALFFGASNALAQTEVTDIYTDYDGYWSSSIDAINGTSPDGLNQLLAFTVSETTFSTGVNDTELDNQGLTYTAAEWTAFHIPALSVSEPPPYAIIIGAALDGDATGEGSFTAPANGDSVAAYLMDGTLGLALGTSVANIPVDSLDISMGAPATAAIGDGVPDLLFVQTGSPTENDSIVMLDENGNAVGTQTAIDWTGINVVGNWDADFYGMDGTALGTNVSRDIRMATFEFSELGVTASNAGEITNVRIVTSGTSDPAFYAYNSASWPGCDALAFTSVSVASPASGAGAADGIVSASISGGTEPYGLSFTFQGDTIYSSSWDTIEPGKYWVKAVDSNDCASSNSLQIFMPHVKCQ